MSQSGNNNNNNQRNGDNAPPNVIFIPLGENPLQQQEEEEEEGEGNPLEEEEGGEEDSMASSNNSHDERATPPELQLSTTEEGWVWNLVKWMEGEDPDCNGKNQQAGGKVPSDYEYAMNAIIAKGNKEKADQNIRAMQRFRQKYDIQDTVEDGVKAFQDIFEMQPGTMLHVDAMPSGGSQQGGSLVVFDFSKWFPSRFRESTNNLRVCMALCYYIFQACAPNFDVLRGGVGLLVETTGMSHRNMDVGLAQQLLSELFVCSPANWKELRFYNTSQLATSFVELLKQFFSEEMKDVVSVGCQVEAVGNSQINDPTGSPALNRILNAVRPNPPRLTLPQVFVQPNYEVAMQNLTAKVRTLLEERYQNEETFELFSDEAQRSQLES